MDKILLAMVGACNSKGEFSGYMGTCIPLAATSTAREYIDTMGEDVVAEWLMSNGVSPPPAGGLWVAELEIEEDVDAPQGYSADSCHWRPPTAEEVDGLIGRQMSRARKHPNARKPTGASTWTFLGSLT